MAIIEVFEYTYRLDGQVCFEFGIVDFLFIGGFQLVDLIITELKSHMTC